MSIPFTSSDLYLDDGAMYFDGCTGFVYNDTTGTVRPFILSCTRRYEEEDEEEVLFVEADHIIEFDLFEGSGENGKRVSGHDLLCDNRYMLSRFPLGYVPIDNGRKLARVTAQPVTRRASKGLMSDFVQSHPIVDFGDEADYLSSMVRNPRRPAWEELCLGIAEVLSLGMPPVMRRNIPFEVARENVRLAIFELFVDPDRLVVVPDFSMAIVKKRGSRDAAYVLYRGRVLGQVRREPDRTLTYVGKIVGKRSNTRPLMKKAQEDVTTRLFADRFVWSN